MRTLQPVRVVLHLDLQGLMCISMVSFSSAILPTEPENVNCPKTTDLPRACPSSSVSGDCLLFLRPACRLFLTACQHTSHGPPEFYFLLELNNRLFRNLSTSLSLSLDEFQNELSTSPVVAFSCKNLILFGTHSWQYVQCPFVHKLYVVHV